MAAGASMRARVLVVLTVQTSVFHVVLRISRQAGAAAYSPAAAVCYTELLKMLASAIVMIYQCKWSTREAYCKGVAEVRDNPKILRLLLVPAVLYTAQNTMVIYSVSYLSAVQFSVARQIKIPVTGVFSVLLLNKQLGIRKWTAIFTVALGVALVQLAKTQQDSYRLLDALTQGSLNSEDRGFGLMFALLSCVTSGLASVWFEMVLKRENVNLWIMNVLLTGMSAFIAAALVIWSAGWEAFFGFDQVALLAVTFSASDGLVIAMVMKYADAILKGFATSVAICITAIWSVLMGDMPSSMQLTVGCATVVGAVLLYSGTSSTAIAKTVHRVSSQVSLMPTASVYPGSSEKRASSVAPLSP